MIQRKPEQYSCTMCGNCCRWPGLVRVKDQEISAIAAYLGKNEQDFIDEYTFLAEDRRSLSLISNEQGHCIFLKDDKCVINDVKPQQCRNFPFTWHFPGWRNKCEMTRHRTGESL